MGGFASWNRLGDPSWVAYPIGLAFALGLLVLAALTACAAAWVAHLIHKRL